MDDQPTEADQTQRTVEFERQAGQSQTGFIAEFFDFLMHNKKWWLAPIILVLSLVGLLIVLGSSGAAPFIYTLF